MVVKENMGPVRITKGSPCFCPSSDVTLNYPAQLLYPSDWDNNDQLPHKLNLPVHVWSHDPSSVMGWFGSLKIRWRWCCVLLLQEYLGKSILGVLANLPASFLLSRWKGTCQPEKMCVKQERDFWERTPLLQNQFCWVYKVSKAINAACFGTTRL